MAVYLNAVSADRETVSAIVHEPPRDSALIHPLRGLLTLVEKIGVSDSLNNTEKPGCSGVVPTLKKHFKRKAVADIQAPTKPASYGSLRGIDFTPQTMGMKRPRLSVGTSAEVIVNGGDVAGTDDIQSWSDDLTEPCHACIFTPKPKEHGPTSDTAVVVDESNPEELPSNQEAYTQEFQVGISQHTVALIKDFINATVKAFEDRSNDRINMIERRLDAFEKKLDDLPQRHSIHLKQITATHLKSCEGKDQHFSSY